MCDPVAGFAISAGSQIMEHQAQGAAVNQRNRAKLRNFEEANRQYMREAQLDDAQWKNDVQLEDIQQDQIYQGMMSQWVEQDKQLDKMFAEADHNIEKAIVEMYENEYAGTQTGRTAARLAGKSAKKLGQYKSQVLHQMMMAKDETALAGERSRLDAQAKSRDAYEKIRFAPIHGHTPMAPDLEAKPGMGGLLLGLAGSAFDAFGPAGSGAKLKGDTDKLGTSGEIAAIGKGGPGVTDAPAASSGLNLAGVNAYSGVSDADVYSAADYFNRPQVDTNYDTFTRGQ